MTDPVTAAESTAADHLRGRIALVGKAAANVTVFWLWPLHHWPPRSPTAAVVWSMISGLAALLWAPLLRAHWQQWTLRSGARLAGLCAWYAAVVAAGIYLFVQ